MIVTPRSLPWPRSQKGIEQSGADFLHRIDLLLNQVAIKEPQRFFFNLESTTESALVREEPFYAFAKEAVETTISGSHKTSSPSPQATSRRASISTLL